ncbi:unnamed protein product [Calypogeia fissa]
MASSGSQQFHRSRGFVPPRQGPTQSEDLGQIGSDQIRLRDEHYELMVSFLEIPEKFQAITGGGRCTKVGGKYQSKAVVMRQFHAALVHRGFPKDISPPNFNKRFQRYVARYKEAREFKTQSGGGMTEDELAVGMTLEEKLNKLCPHFERMHEIYGGRPNVRPDLEADVGVNAHDYIFPEESGDTDARLLEAAREHIAKENMNPNQQGEHTPTQLLPGNHTGSPSESCYSAPAPLHVPEAVLTPTTLHNAQVDTQFWKDMREFEQVTLIRHNNSCQCLECRGPHGVQTGESCPAPTESANNQPDLGATPPARPAPPKKGGKASAAPGKEKVPPRDKPVLKEKPDNVLKPSFAAIYAEKNAQKADFRLNLIQSRDK